MPEKLLLEIEGLKMPLPRDWLRTTDGRRFGCNGLKLELLGLCAPEAEAEVKVLMEVEH